MKALSPDLGQRVLAAYYTGEGTQQQVADRFKFSVQWVRKVLR